MKKTSKKFDPLSLEKKILGNNFIRSLRIFKKFGKSFERKMFNEENIKQFFFCLTEADRKEEAILLLKKVTEGKMKKFWISYALSLL